MNKARAPKISTTFSAPELPHVDTGGASAAGQIEWS